MQPVKTFFLSIDVSRCPFAEPLLHHIYASTQRMQGFTYALHNIDLRRVMPCAVVLQQLRLWLRVKCSQCRHSTCRQQTGVCQR